MSFSTPSLRGSSVVFSARRLASTAIWKVRIGELRARLADRLRRDDADRLAEVHHVPARQIAP
jgi:hypothetical protein